MKATLILQIALAVACFGMAVLIVGVLSPALFYPGIFLIGIGLLGSAVAGVMAMVQRADAA